MKKLWILLAVVVVVAVVAAIMLTGKEPAWSVEGRLVTADSCAVGCPCIFGEPPTHATCQYVGIFRVEKGNYGEVNLENTSFALVGEFARPTQAAAQDYQYVAYYIDANASRPQRRALRKILTGPAFADLGKPAEVKEVAIGMTGMEAFGQVGKTYGGTVGDIAKVEVTPIEGAIPGKPLTVENSAEPLFHWTALGKASNSYYKAGGKDFQFEGTSGESHRFSFSGGGD